MDHSPLARLAPELRNRVYELALTHSDRIKPLNGSHHAELADHNQLTSTCRQVRTETLGMFYAVITFALSAQNSFEIFWQIHRLRSLIHRLDPRILSQIGRIDVGMTALIKNHLYITPIGFYGNIANLQIHSGDGSGTGLELDPLCEVDAIGALMEAYRTVGLVLRERRLPDDGGPRQLFVGDEDQRPSQETAQALLVACASTYERAHPPGTIDWCVVGTYAEWNKGPEKGQRGVLRWH